MNVQYCSDLHLEFAENSRFIKKHPLIPKAELLILAGDILTFKTIQLHNNFIDFVSDQFEMVYWLPGNHEYYGSDISDKPFSFFEKVRNNVFLVNNVSVNWKEIELLFSTLWTNISLVNREEISCSLSDFFTVRMSQRRFTPNDYNSLHSQSRHFIEKYVGNKTHSKRIIVSHHVPTLLHYPEKYLGDKLNEAFVVELDDLIESSNADYWIYGHHHCNTPQLNIGKTKLVTNQLGYVHRNEHVLFKQDAIIEI